MYSSIVHPDPESQHVWRVAQKKDKKKTTTHAFIFVDRSRWSGKSTRWWMGCCGDSGLEIRTLQKAVISSFLVAEKGQEKGNNSHFYIRWSGLEIRSSTALKFLTIVESKAKD